MADNPKKLLWVYYGSLDKTLSSATWVETSAELIGLGWDVTLAAADLPADCREARLKLLPLPKPGLYFGGYLIFHLAVAFHLLFHKNSYSAILFNQHSVPFIIPVALFQRLFRRRPVYVMDIRSVPMMTGTERSKRWQSLFAISEKLANRHADSITAITLPAAQAARVPAAKLSGIWPSGVRVQSYQAAARQRTWPEGPAPIRFIYIGALHADRNLFEFIEAVQTIRQAGAALEFVLIGSGPEEAKLRAYIERHPDAGIILKPAIPHSQIPAELGLAHVGVLPFPDDLKYQVSSPVKLFEYMAAGRAILSSDLPVLHEVLDEHNAILVPPPPEGEPAWYAALERLAALPELRQRLSAQARRDVERYPWIERAKKSLANFP